MAGMLDRVRASMGQLITRPARVSPFAEMGFGGSATFGGQVARGERNPRLAGEQRWTTARDLMVNYSIVAASLRYFLNMVARPSWTVVPAEDQGEGKSSDAAKQAAEFVETLLHGTDASWTRIVRRSGNFRFHGYGLHEWTAKRRDDGLIGFGSIEVRPPHTIRGWDLDPHSNVLGVEQRSPQTGDLVYLPRQKLIYFVDDSLTDDPEGLGWYRQLVESSDRMKRYLDLEKVAFERDLAGTPIGRAPYAAIKAAVRDKVLTEAEGKELTRGIEEFVRNTCKQPDTSLMLDSQTFLATGASGEKQISAVEQWGIDLLKAEAGSVEELGAAIERTTWDMALIMGTERLLVGREGAGSLALSEDTTQNLILNIDSTTGEMAEGYDRDMIGPAWALNGFPDELRPTLKVEDASFKDVAKVARVLADMASAGAILAPDDPAIDDVRDLAGISRQPEMTEERMLMLAGGAREGQSPHDNPDDLNDPKSGGAA